NVEADFHVDRLEAAFDAFAGLPANARRCAIEHGHVPIVGNAIAHSSAEELMQWETGGFANDIPQRHLKRCGGHISDVRIVVPAPIGRICKEGSDTARVASLEPDSILPQGFDYQANVRASEGFAYARDALVGHDLDYRGRETPQSPKAPRFRFRERHGNY